MIVNKKQEVYHNWPQEEWQPRRKKRLKSNPKIFFKFTSILVLMMVAGCFCHLFNQTRIAKVNYHLMQETQNLEKLIHDNQLLEVEIAKLESLDRIEMIARNELQMTEPQEIKWIPASN